MRWPLHGAGMGETRSKYRVVVGIPEGMRPLGRHRIRYDDNIKICLKEIVWEAADCFHLAQKRVNGIILRAL
jgi:hypothetical protein